jgi:hypothetical protein
VREEELLLVLLLLHWQPLHTVSLQLQALLVAQPSPPHPLLVVALHLLLLLLLLLLMPLGTLAPLLYCLPVLLCHAVPLVLLPHPCSVPSLQWPAVLLRQPQRLLLLSGRSGVLALLLLLLLLLRRSRVLALLLPLPDLHQELDPCCHAVLLLLLLLSLSHSTPGRLRAAPSSSHTTPGPRLSAGGTAARGDQRR